MRPVTIDGTEVCPGVLGGVEWNRPALNRELNTLFVNAVDWCSTFTAAETVRHIPGRMYMGGTVNGSGPAIAKEIGAWFAGRLETG